MREITGDTFRPTLLTEAAITRLTQLTNNTTLTQTPLAAHQEAHIANPSPAYILDPYRGVEMESALSTNGPPPLAEIVSADSISDSAPIISEQTLEETLHLQTADNGSVNDNHIREIEQAEELVAVRNSINEGYQVGPPPDEQIFAALTIKASRALYGDVLTDAACIEELQNCITKGVWECLDLDYNPLVWTWPG